jgi:hypothetical protein
LHVVNVTTDDPAEPAIAYWEFDHPVTLNAPTVGNFRVLVDGVWLQAVAAWQSEDVTLRVQYPTDQVLDGCDYSIDEAPSGIVQAAAIVLPQEGTVHSP